MIDASNMDEKRLEETACQCFELCGSAAFNGWQCPVCGSVGSDPRQENPKG